MLSGLQSFFHEKAQLETKPNNESVLIILLPKLGAIDCNTHGLQREVARTAHTLKMMVLTSGTVAALQRSPEQQSNSQVPSLQASVSVAVLQKSAEIQPLP